MPAGQPPAPEVVGVPPPVELPVEPGVLDGGAGGAALLEGLVELGDGDGGGGGGGGAPPVLPG